MSYVEESRPIGLRSRCYYYLLLEIYLLIFGYSKTDAVNNLVIGSTNLKYVFKDYYYGDQMKGNKVGGNCSTDDKHEVFINNKFVDLRADGTILLRWIVKRNECSVWPEFSCA
jgi:hypothetical protein